jgi:hypothetical protein
LQNNKQKLLCLTIATLLIAAFATLATANATIPPETSWTGKGATAHWSIPIGDPVQYVTIDVVAAQHMALEPGDDVVYMKVTHLGTHGTSEKTYKGSFVWGTNLAAVILEKVLIDFSGTPRSHDIVIVWNAAPTPDIAFLTLYDTSGYHRQINYEPYISESASVSTQTTPIVGSSDSTGLYANTFNPGVDIYAKGTGYSPGLYTAYVVRDITWTDGLTISTTPIVTTTPNVEADAIGNLVATKVFSDATPGYYDIVIDVDYNGIYDPTIDALCDNILFTGGFFVVPEYAYGALFALASCFAALIVLKKLPIIKPQI